MAKGKKGGLGRGLSALISGREDDVAPVMAAADATAAVAPPQHGERLIHLDPQDIEPNPQQPRKEFDEDALHDLSESIRRDGVQEPIIVRQVGDQFELVSGERRVRASIMADMKTIPAVCRDVSDDDMLKLGLIENIQREDLNPVELAGAYQMLIDQFSWTQEECADQVGKKRATVTNTLRLLNLPQDVQRHLAKGDIAMGHARALLALDTPKAQSAGCRKIIDQGLSVRQAEKLATPAKPKSPAKAKDPNVAGLEDELRRKLGTKVSLKTGSKGRGRIEIDYYSLDELERLLDLLRSTR
ncbi:MAG: ParB/RepB/Spo0J family partition protein [bacterium]|nr:ParB/RepB/Spo0J family partition protein [bacterium]